MAGTLTHPFVGMVPWPRSLVESRSTLRVLPCIIFNFLQVAGVRIVHLSLNGESQALYQGGAKIHEFWYTCNL